MMSCMFTVKIAAYKRCLFFYCCESKCQIWLKVMPNSNVPEILAKTQHHQSCYSVELIFIWEIISSNFWWLFNWSLMKSKTMFRHVNFYILDLCLQLSQSVPVGRTIRRIPLPPPNMNLQSNQMCHVAGWGWTEDSHQRIVPDLRVVGVSVVDQNVCRRQWSKTRLNLPAHVICAGGYKTLEGACKVSFLSIFGKFRDT